MCIEKTPKAAFFKSQSLSKPIRQLKGDRGTDKNTSMIRNLTSYEQKIFRTALDGIYDVTFNRLEKQKASTNSNIRNTAESMKKISNKPVQWSLEKDVCANLDLALTKKAIENYKWTQSQMDIAQNPKLKLEEEIDG